MTVELERRVDTCYDLSCSVLQTCEVCSRDRVRVTSSAIVNKCYSAEEPAAMLAACSVIHMSQGSCTRRLTGQVALLDEYLLLDFVVTPSICISLGGLRKCRLSLLSLFEICSCCEA